MTDVNKVGDIEPNASDDASRDGDVSAEDTSDDDPSPVNLHNTCSVTKTTGSKKGRAINNNNAHTTLGARVDTCCEATANCVAGSGDHRKTVSHIFGRNKAETRGISEDCWIKWCRKHYQRYSYRDSLNGNWHKHQLGLVREQLDRFENRTNIDSWKITLRKKEQAKLDAENALVAAGLITLNTPDSAATITSNATGVALTTVSSTSPTSGAVASTATDTTTLDINSVPTSADAATSSAVTLNDGSDTGPTSDAVATASPNPLSFSKETSVSVKPEIDDESDSFLTAPSEVDNKADDAATNDNTTTTAAPEPPLWERFLVPHLGTGKTFAQVRTVCDVIDREFNTPAFKARDVEKMVFPGIEFLPHFPDGKGKKAVTKTTVNTSNAKGTKRKAPSTNTAAPAAPAKRQRLGRGSKA